MTIGMNIVTVIWNKQSVTKQASFPSRVEANAFIKGLQEDDNVETITTKPEGEG